MVKAFIQNSCNDGKECGRNMTQQEITLLERQISKYKLAGISLIFSNINTKKNSIPVLSSVTDMRDVKSNIVIDCTTLNNGNIELSKNLVKRVSWHEYNIGSNLLDKITLINLNQTIQNIDYLQKLKQYMMLNYGVAQWINPEIVKVIDSLIQYNCNKLIEIKNFKDSLTFISIMNEWDIAKANDYLMHLSNTDQRFIINNGNWYKNTEWDNMSYTIDHNINELSKIKVNSLPNQAKQDIKSRLSNIIQLLVDYSTRGYSTFIIKEMSPNKYRQLQDKKDVYKIYKYMPYERSYNEPYGSELKQVNQLVIEVCSIVKYYDKSIDPRTEIGIHHRKVEKT
jgi:hypothetical protein